MAGIAKNIKEQRRKAGLSQEELAKKLYVTRQTVSNYETGKSNPDIETLEQLTKVFQVDMEQLLYGKQRTFNKKEVIKTIIFCGAILLILAVAPVLIDKEKQLIKNTFKIVGFSYAYWVFLLPFCLTMLGMGLTRLVFLLTNGKPLRIPKKKYIYGSMVGISILIFGLLLYYGASFLAMGAENYLGWPLKAFYGPMSSDTFLYRIFWYLFVMHGHNNMVLYVVFPVWGMGLYLTKS